MEAPGTDVTAPRVAVGPGCCWIVLRSGRLSRLVEAARAESVIVIRQRPLAASGICQMVTRRGSRCGVDVSRTGSGIISVIPGK